MCFGSQIEPSHRDGSFEYQQHMFWLRNKKNGFQLRTLIGGGGGGGLLNYYPWMPLENTAFANVM